MTEYENVAIEKTKKSCSLCEDYAAREAEKAVVVMSCEGACLRGEIARQAANIVCFELAREKTARLCLGGAFTKNAGQRHLARSAQQVIAVEGCVLECASRMMKGVVPELAPTVVVADRHYQFDRRLFSMDEMPAAEIRQHASEVAAEVARLL